MHRREIKSIYINPNDVVDPVPGVRYFMTECGGSKQPLKDEIIAMVISFLLTGVVPLLIVLTVIGWYSVRARSIREICSSFGSCIIALLPFSPNSL